MVLAREKTTVNETKHLDVTLQKADGGEYSFVMSSTDPDRVNDSFAKSAYDSLIGKKLLALFSHDHEKPIGFWENMRIEGKKLVGDLSLAPTNLGKMLDALLKHGTPLMSSVGFRPVDYDAKKGGGLHFKSVEWLECSVVAVGMHQDAIRLGKQFDLTEEEVKSIFTESDEPSTEEIQLDLQMKAHDARNRAAAAIQKANDAILYKRKR